MEGEIDVQTLPFRLFPDSPFSTLGHALSARARYRPTLKPGIVSSRCGTSTPLKMPFIAFLGCDGSGKSAVIHAVTKQLEAAGHRVIPGHWCPKPFTDRGADSATAEDPHGKKTRGAASSILKLGWLWLNWWAAWIQYLRRGSRSGFVLFDRYHGDLLVDPARYRYGGPMWLARLASQVMPQPDLVIFLDAEPDVLLSRKQEVGRSALEDSRRGYLEFCHGNSRCRIIDASQPLEAVIVQAMNSAANLAQRSNRTLPPQ